MQPANKRLQQTATKIVCQTPPVSLQRLEWRVRVPIRPQHKARNPRVREHIENKRPVKLLAFTNWGPQLKRI